MPAQPAIPADLPDALAGAHRTDPVPDAAAAPGPGGPVLRAGRLSARLATSAGDLDRALALRQQCFRAGPGGRPDRDGFDARCLHGLVEDQAAGRLLGCFRLLPLAPGQAAHFSYSAQFYDLERLSRHPGAMLELGRFCVARGEAGADVLRLAWALIAHQVEARKVAFLFGCSSFPGADPARHAAALADLGARHLAPPAWRPGPRAPEAVALADAAAAAGPPPAPGPGALPPLLRSYLAMGGRVGPLAVIDRDLDTLHVFTGVEVAAIPPSRARALRGLARALAGPGAAAGGPGRGKG